MEKNDAIYNIVELLDDFFKEDNAKSISLFFWKKEKEDNKKLDVRFSYKIIDVDREIESFKECKLYSNITLKQNFMNCDSIYELSELIEDILSVKEPITENYKECSAFFNGVFFDKENWKSVLDRIFKEKVLNPYQSIKLSDKLRSNLSLRNDDIKKSKV